MGGWADCKTSVIADRQGVTEVLARDIAKIWELVPRRELWDCVAAGDSPALSDNQLTELNW